MTARDALLQTSPSIARRDAELLVAHVLGCERVWLLANSEVELSDVQLTQLQALLLRRKLGEPLQYLLGTQEFYGLPMIVTPDVLIPRPETEHLVEAVLLWAAQQDALQQNDARNLRIADVGTGSGAIAIALATHLGAAEFFALDISHAALDIAERNARANACDDRIRFIESDLLSALLGESELDAIVSNPPYVPLRDLPTLAIEVREHEPHRALFAGDDGLALYRRLIPQAMNALRGGGLLAMEFGFDQRDALAELLTDWDGVCFVDDLQRIPRVALALRP